MSNIEERISDREKFDRFSMWTQSEREEQEKLAEQERTPPSLPDRSDNQAVRKTGLWTYYTCCRCCRRSKTRIYGMY